MTASRSSSWEGERGERVKTHIQGREADGSSVPAALDRGTFWATPAVAPEGKRQAVRNPTEEEAQAARLNEEDLLPQTGEHALWGGPCYGVSTFLRRPFD